MHQPRLRPDVWTMKATETETCHCVHFRSTHPADVETSVFSGPALRRIATVGGHAPVPGWCPCASVPHRDVGVGGGSWEECLVTVVPCTNIGIGSGATEYFIFDVSCLKGTYSHANGS